MVTSAGGVGAPPTQLHGHLLFYFYTHFDSSLGNFLLGRSIFKQLQVKTITNSLNRDFKFQILFSSRLLELGP